ncbi:glycoside hydrolase family 16 protein [Sclerotinia borealis F-4128]|uniref:Crh-like protein n=1 Tax=Sclerotinia borealis (strain F-4128) TaxID=1432307 RepID=W9CLX7_SCLBF|nr:glycoside hydrolase family 16 protein [Sclerotinia borealis F-4128]
MVGTSTLLAFLASASVAFAACSLDSHCPEDAPCCSQYGECGTGAYCLGGCDPRMSFSVASCVPEPVCESASYTFKNLDGITSNTKYLGDASKSNWVYSGSPVIYNDNVLLTMSADSVGTVMASSTYMWYGNVKAKFKTSRGQGVITAFILFSDVKDEIDFEFVGSDLATAQSNYYFQGITNYDNELDIKLSDTYANYHTYEIDWTPDEITWLIDGQVGRTKKRADTWNATANQWNFPQTPARVQLSLWPGGLATNGAGTISWAGGVIDWDSEDIKNNGYYYASFESVDVSCYNAKSAPGTNSGKSYYYTNALGTNNTVVDSNNATILSSLLGTGTNMTAGESAATSGSTAGSTAGTVPGLTGSNGGGVGDTHSDGGSGSSGTATESSSTSSSTDSGGFSQGGGSSSSSSSSSGTTSSSADSLVANQERVLKGSIFAGVVAVVAMMAL